MVKSTFYDTVKEKLKTKSEATVLVPALLLTWSALVKSQASLILSIQLEFCISYSEIFRYFPSGRIFSKSIDLLKIYILISQYFLISLYIWIPQHFPAQEISNLISHIS